MSGPEATGPDATKTCPFCAETIRAAAIKCRYCQSDLTDAPSTPPSKEDAQRPAPPAPAPPAPAPLSPAPAARAPSRRPRPRSLSAPGPLRSRAVRLVALPLCLLLTVGFLALAVRDWRERDDLEQAARAGQVARAAVADKVEALLSYRHATFDDDVAAAQKLLTDSFREEYTPTVAEIRKRALAQKRDQQAEVLAVGLVSSDEDAVRALVFVNTLSAREQGEQAPTVMQNRVTVDLVREGDTWLIDDFTFPTS